MPACLAGHHERFTALLVVFIRKPRFQLASQEPTEREWTQSHEAVITSVLCIIKPICPPCAATTLQQAERDRELTFQPRLATTKYWAAVARRRRRRAACMLSKENLKEAGAGRTSMADVAGCQEKYEREATGVPGTKHGIAQARFEMLYQDVSSRT